MKAYPLIEHVVFLDGVQFQTGVPNADGNTANRILVGNDLGSLPKDQISLASTVDAKFRGWEFLAFGLVFFQDTGDAGFPSSDLTRDIFRAELSVAEGRFFFQKPGTTLDIMASSQNSFDGFTVRAIPEPGPLVIFVLGLAGLGVLLKHTNRASV